VIDAEHAFDAADDATDRTSDDEADGTGDFAAPICPVRDTARDALGLRNRRNSDCCKDRSCDDEFH
jgi:hypothetical protein